MIQIAIFASGNGSNAKQLISYFNSKPNSIAKISLIVTNNKSAGVLEIAVSHKINTHILSRADFYDSEKTLLFLKEQNIDLIILAGFLWLIPQNLIRTFENKIINIHPALLPKFGGKGMHGIHVHQAVKESQEIETGITIHFVNEKYDDGKILFQAKCSVDKDDSSYDIEQKVHKLEHLYFAPTIENLLLADLTPTL